MLKESEQRFTYSGSRYELTKGYLYLGRNTYAKKATYSLTRVDGDQKQEVFSGYSLERAEDYLTTLFGNRRVATMALRALEEEFVAPKRKPAPVRSMGLPTRIPTPVLTY